VNFPVEALYKSVKDSLEQSARPSWKKPRATLSCVVVAKVPMVSEETEEVPDWETRVPVDVAPVKDAFCPVRFPLSTRYDADTPLSVEVLETTRLVVEAVPVVVEFVVVMPVPVAVILPAVMMPMFAAGPEEEPVRFPETFPVIVPETMSCEVVAVPETMRFEVEAVEVAMRVPMVPSPIDAALAVMLLVNVWSWFQEFAVVVPNAREIVFAEKRTG
jgi:hypothetical protein